MLKYCSCINQTINQSINHSLKGFPKRSFTSKNSPCMPRRKLNSTFFMPKRMDIAFTKRFVGDYLASHAYVLRGSSCVPAPLTYVEPEYKFLSHCSQISAGDHMQIIGGLISAVRVLISQTGMRTSFVECDTWQKIFAPDKNLGDKRWLFVYFSV